MREDIFERFAYCWTRSGAPPPPPSFPLSIGILRFSAENLFYLENAERGDRRAPLILMRTKKQDSISVS
jgi:hypothetical protein